MTYFLNKLKNVRSLDESSCSWVSGGTVAGVDRGVLGLVFGAEAAGVAKGVFEVDVMILFGLWLGGAGRKCAVECGEAGTGTISSVAMADLGRDKNEEVDLEVGVRTRECRRLEQSDEMLALQGQLCKSIQPEVGDGDRGIRYHLVGGTVMTSTSRRQFWALSVAGARQAHPAHNAMTGLRGSDVALVLLIKHRLTRRIYELTPGRVFAVVTGRQALLVVL
jgi:hypothetical protein